MNGQSNHKACAADRKLVRPVQLVGLYSCLAVQLCAHRGAHKLTVNPYKLQASLADCGHGLSLRGVDRHSAVLQLLIVDCLASAHPAQQAGARRSYQHAPGSAAPMSLPHTATQAQTIPDREAASNATFGHICKLADSKDAL